MKLLSCSVIGCLIGLAVGFAQPPKESPLKVLSAKRAQEYRSAGGQSLTASDTKKDLVLVVELGGITVDEFQKLDKDDLYVMAGERRCVPNVSSSGIIDGKAQILVGVVVPRDVLKFKLFAGAKRTVDFAAPAKIQDLVE